LQAQGLSILTLCKRLQISDLSGSEIY
jgi:hypothetical protein